MHLLYNDNGLKNCYRQLGQIIHQPLDSTKESIITMMDNQEQD